MLEVKNIHKKFGTNEVLKGVDFKVEKGSVIAVLGNSGSGKTTLLRCISFLEQADKGEITFDDFHKDITAVTRKEIRDTIFSATKQHLTMYWRVLPLPVRFLPKKRRKKLWKCWKK